MGLTQTVAPTEEPVTLDEAKLHLRVDVKDDDAYITALIEAARLWVESYTKRQLVTATYALTLDAFPTKIILPRPNALTVSSITYTDTDGDSQTLASSQYTLTIDGVFGCIVEAYNVSWPSTRDIPNAVTVTYTAGYGAASAVPESAKVAVKMLLSDLYERRSAANERAVQPNAAVESLLWSLKVVEFV